MKKMEDIAERNAEFFIERHFSKLGDRDKLVMHMRKSVREIIKNALITYEHTRPSN